MYGILAACIVGMAMFLGLFAISIETGTAERQDKLIIQPVKRMASAPVSAQ